MLRSGGPSYGRLTFICLTVLLLPGILAGCMSTDRPARVSFSVPEALIWSHPYATLTIIVEYVEGFEPSEAALQEMIATLEEVTDKETIMLAKPSVIPDHTNDPNRTWSDDELHEIHMKHAEKYVEGQGDTAFLFVNYLDGIGDDDPQDSAWARGHAFRNDLFLFHEGVRADYAYGVVPRLGAENMERHVLMHELGHALGLVNCGVPMLTDRETPDSECHSTEEDSVMNAGIEDWKVDADAVSGRENTLAPLRFTAADLADLAAFRDEGREDMARRSLRADPYHTTPERFYRDAEISNSSAMPVVPLVSRT